MTFKSFALLCVLALLCSLPAMGQHVCASGADCTVTGKWTFPAPVNPADPSTKAYADTKADSAATTSALATKANDSGVVHNTGNETVAGSKAFSDMRCAGHGCFDVTASPYGADPTGVADSSTAFQSAITAAGNGGEVRVPPGTYKACNLTITASVDLHGVGSRAWGAASSSAPVVVNCDQSGGVVFHIVSPSGNTTILHNGPTIRNLLLQDTTNSGAGGLANGGILVESTSRWFISGVSCNAFTKSGAYCFSLSQPNNSVQDNSYGILEQPFVRNTDVGISATSYSDGTLVRGGEIHANSIGIDIPNQSALNSTAMYVFGTSIEIPTNGIGLRTGSQNTVVDARFEGDSGATGNRLVQVLGTGKRNTIRGIFIKGEIQVELQSGSQNNSVDITNDASFPGQNGVLAKVVDSGLGNTINEAGVRNLWGFNAGGFLSTHGLYFGRTVAAVNQGFTLSGRYGTLFRNAPSTFQQVGASSLVRDSSGNVAITFPTTFQTAVGQSLVIDSATDSTFNTNSCPVTVVTDTTHVTCSSGVLSAAATTGYAYVYDAAGLNLSAPDGQSAFVGFGVEQAQNTSSLIASGVGAAFFVFDKNGNITGYCNSATTPGSSFTRSQCIQITPTGATVNGTLATTSTGSFGGTITPTSAGGGALGDSTHPWSCVQLGTSSTSRSNLCTNVTSAAKAQFLPNLPGTLAAGDPSAFLTSAYTNATTTFSNVTGLSFSVAASTNYNVQCNLAYQTSATTANIKLQWTGPASPTAVTYDVNAGITSSTSSTGVATAFSSSLATSGTPTTATNMPLVLHMTVINGANAGTVQLQAAATGTGTVTIAPGSCVIRQ